MAKAKSFLELRAGMSTEARAASADEYRRLVEEISICQRRETKLTRAKTAGDRTGGREMPPKN